MTDAGSRADGGTQALAWPVVIFAHNEERRIAACLDSVFAADPDRGFEVFVLANGCRDGTEAIVAGYGRRRQEVRLVSIAMGDKCNAWNVFVHDTVPAHCPGRDVYFFMDGDMQAARGSFSAMARALQTNPHAHAASAVPLSGRNAERYRREIIEGHGLMANLYCLRGSFVDRLRALPVRMPIRLEGDDGLIGALIKWDLAPDRNHMDDERIAPCADAGFRFESMRLADWRSYWRRVVRYGRRSYEFQLLGHRLAERGIAALPRDITEIYPEAAALPLKWAGVHTLANWVALRQMRKHRGAQR
jgi:glycosyltransferase involved in cell wall biosynthesis